MQTEDRIIRSATIENMADEDGVVNIEQLLNLYNKISAKTIITGFVAVSDNGRAMQKLQAGIYNDGQQNVWKEFVRKFKEHNPDKKLIIQLAHTGRQTTRNNAVGASNRICTYFRNVVKPLKTDEVDYIINEFATAALRAKNAGFDGCQIHAAHGYLIHQFLSPYTNNRKDIYADGVIFLESILQKIRYVTGDNFALWIKISSADDTGLTLEKTIETIKRVEHLIDNVEVSYGTMEYALNIIRGACPVDVIFQVNPLFNKFPAVIKFIAKRTIAKHFTKKFKPFEYNYNLDAALRIKKETNVPVTVVGGIRKWEDIYNILNSGIDYVSMSRPFICEPDLVTKIRQCIWKKSKCTNCNLCTVYCDSENQLRCYVYDEVN